MEELELFKTVSGREWMVLQLVAQGRTNKEIAKGMCLSVRRLFQKRQIPFHIGIKSIYFKLLGFPVRNRRLVRLAAFSTEL
ncbi:hypothetical protein D8M30_17865 [Corynebacterium pseudodiphtheriticum]|nr:hypothetical protein D8M30_17865 [Corynebacterium pseudodiphtheriticum]